MAIYSAFAVTLDTHGNKTEQYIKYLAGIGAIVKIVDKFSEILHNLLKKYC